MTSQKIPANDAKQLGLVNEVLAPEELMPRASELAHQLAELPTLTLRYTRLALTQRMKRLLDEGHNLGMMFEGMGVLDMLHGKSPGRTDK